jgi:hypothetical protein
MLFLLIAVINRQLNNFGLSFNAIFAYIGGLGTYFIIGWFISTKYGLFIGLVVALIAGYIGGNMYGGDDSD